APVSIDDQPIQNLLPSENSAPSAGNLGRAVTLQFLGSMQGYDVAQKQVPSDLTIDSGRNLNADDAGTNNVLVPNQLVTTDPLKGHLKLGSKILYSSVDRKTTLTVTVVGTYTSQGINFGQILTTTDAVKALSPNGEVQSIFMLKIDDKQVGKAV